MNMTTSPNFEPGTMRYTPDYVRRTFTAINDRLSERLGSADVTGDDHARRQAYAEAYGRLSSLVEFAAHHGVGMPTVDEARSYVRGFEVEQEAADVEPVQHWYGAHVVDQAALVEYYVRFFVTDDDADLGAEALDVAQVLYGEGRPRPWIVTAIFETTETGAKRAVVFDVREPR